MNYFKQSVLSTIMKPFILLSLFITIVFCGPVANKDDQNSLSTFLGSDSSPMQHDLARKIPEATLRWHESDIKFFFHSKNGPTDGTQVFAKDSDGILAAGFCKEKPTLFIIHGWKNEYNAPVIEIISKAALEAMDINVFAVDWGTIAERTYLEAFSSVPEVGRLVGDLMESLVANNGLDLGDTTVAGHSLGAHVAGIACAQVGSECDLVVGMDPALPFFFYDQSETRLDTGDAKFVQIIHTNGGQLGFFQALGHADYYPNGGKKQPGCDFDIFGSCCHGRSYRYYAESLVTGNFTAVKCDSYEDYNGGGCADQPKSFMGQFRVDRSANGTYFLNTHKSAPYAMGDEN